MIKIEGLRLALVRGEDIDPAVPFLLSYGFDPADLRASLERVGQITPLILQPAEGRYRLICGYRRRLILQELGREEYQALILPPGLNDREALGLALEDNLSQRPFNAAEKVLALSHLSRFHSPAELIEDFLPRLGLPPRVQYLDRFLRLSELGPAGLTALAGGDLDPETGEMILIMPPEDRAAVIDLLNRLRPGLNKRKQVVTWLQEIGRREDVSVRTVIEGPEIRAVIQSERLNLPQKEKAVRELLRARRYPRLKELEEKQACCLKRLNLPPKVRLEPPLNFEGLDFTIRISFADLKELKESLDALNQVAAGPDLAALVELG